jgi:hypothetical protein
MRELEISVSLNVSFSGTTFRIVEQEEEEGILPRLRAGFSLGGPEPPGRSGRSDRGLPARKPGGPA